MPRRLLIRVVPALPVLAVAALAVAPATDTTLVVAPVQASAAAAPRVPELLVMRAQAVPHEPKPIDTQIVVGEIVARSLSPRVEPRNPEFLAIRAQAALPEPKPTPAERAASFALEAVGIPYRWGGESPESGFDCSGLVRWAYRRAGVEVPHNSYALYSVGQQVATSGMEAGDVLFFEGLGHVGLYLGRGEMVHSPQTGKHVEVIRLDETNYGTRLIGARRVAASTST